MNLRISLLAALLALTLGGWECSAISGGGAMSNGSVGGARVASGPPPEPPPSTLFFSALNTDGTSNSSRTALDAIQTWDAQGEGGGDATQATLLKRPIHMPSGAGTSPLVSFDGWQDCTQIQSSTTAINALHDAGTFDIVMMIRPKNQASVYSVLESANSVGERGFFIRRTTGGAFNIQIFRSAASVLLTFTTTGTAANGQWVTLRFKGTGARVEFQKNWGAAENSGGYAAFSAPGNASNNLAIGGRYDCNANWFDMDVAYIAVNNEAFTTDEITQIQAWEDHYFSRATGDSVAVIGDSLTSGQTGPTSYTWPQRLQNALGVSVANHGVSGATTAQMLTRWTSHVRSKGYTHVAIFNAVNSHKADITGASTWADHKQIIDEANSDGLSVVFAQHQPWKQYSTQWTAGRQTETEAYMASAAAYTANFDGYVDTYASMGGEGGYAASMLTAYRHTDLLHLSNTGNDFLADEVASVWPP